MTAGIVIATKNRRDELRRALISATSQLGVAEILVMDDGSNDGTAAMVSKEFPTIRLHRCEESKGYIAQRNLAAQLASSDVIVSIDDDAEFSSKYVVVQTLRDFTDSRIAAIAIPYVEPKKGAGLLQSSPDSTRVWVTSSFIGTAHAIRRELFLALGGYRQGLVHQGEESDLAVRMLDAGFVIRLGSADPIRHWESPKRDFARMDFYGPRNSILFHAHNAPFSALLPALCGTIVNCLRLTSNPLRLRVRLYGICDGVLQSLRGPRAPVRLRTYRLWRRLRKRGPFLFADVVTTLLKPKSLSENA